MQVTPFMNISLQTMKIVEIKVERVSLNAVKYAHMLLTYWWQYLIIEERTMMSLDF